MRLSPFQAALATLLVPMTMTSGALADPPQAERPRWQHGSRVIFVGFMEDGKQLLTASQDGSYRVWTVATAKELRRFGKEAKADPASKTPPTLAMPRDGRLLAVAGHDGTIQLWDPATGKELRTLGTAGAGKESSQPVSLAFAPDGKILAVRCPDHVVRLFAVAAGKEVGALAKISDPKVPRRIRFAYGPHCDNGLAFAPDGKTLVSIDVELEPQRGVVRAWTVAAGKMDSELKLEQNNPFFDGRTGHGVAALAFPQQRKILLAWASSDGTARLYEPTADKEPRRLAAIQQGVYVAFVFSPDGRLLAARASNSSAIRLYDTETGRQVVIPNEPARPTDGSGFSSQQLAFSLDGKILAGALGDTVRLWEVASGKEMR